ncbi:Tol-Pal system protein TolB [Paracoccus sp. S-4012]|uniref:Tol-Pal system beta propeller repeat protein TolB n=1 Tax=Paracoccus sp. S-4012 TaxID=2665648 RepID=UPI0012B0EE40|nr:Tol-Pal system beta propeller repeat protein TolB [Paracoccus sp. S-4012]MRX49157.1 Tol-Pal system protein TolB [Paracoccus sp. S-4012]
MTLSRRSLLALGATLPLLARPAAAQPLRIEITEGVSEPMTIAIPPFLDEGGAAEQTRALRDLVARDLTGTGLFREIATGTMPAQGQGIDAAPAWQEWRAADAQALVLGAARMDAGKLHVSFRLYDIFAARPLGDGLSFDGPPEGWRRLGHKLADRVYSRLTGEDPYFDSRIAFVAESGPRTARIKRLAVMDQDGENVRYLTDGAELVLSPRFSADGRRIVFVSFAGGAPRLAEIALDGGPPRLLPSEPGVMAFAPRPSRDGRWLVHSRSRDGDTDIWQTDATGSLARALVTGAGIDTAPGLAPDSSAMVFESDRSGAQQLYLMQLDGGGEAQRISFGEGRYSTPAWSSTGDLIAFTRRVGDRFMIGVMRPDGSGERLLTEGPHDEGPSWSPNGRVVVFTRQERAENGRARLHAVDIAGRDMRPVELKAAASDPDWGPLLP